MSPTIYSTSSSYSSSRLHSRESFTAALSASKSSSKKGSNEKFTTDTDTDQESLPASFKGNLEGAFTSSLKACAGVVPKALKKMKRVQFQDGNQSRSFFKCSLTFTFSSLLL